MDNTKAFLLDLPKEWVDMLDAYCTSKNIARTGFFRQLFKAWMISNSSELSIITEQMVNSISKLSAKEFKESLKQTSEMIRALTPVPNYLDRYRDTKMYDLMVGDRKIPQETVSSNMSYNERESLKDFADKAFSDGFFDESVLIKDIAHWQRYLEIHSDKKITFLEYVDRKYTNPDLKTY